MSAAFSLSEAAFPAAESKGPLRKIPAGEFVMGSKTNALLNAGPRHRVSVDAFELAIVPVTVAEYALFLHETAHDAPRDWGSPRFSDSRQPVVGVSGLDADAYCAWISARTGRRFRLPTEAEREWAALGGRDVEYPWGDAPLDRAGPLPRPDRVGLGAPNGFGLHDMGSGVHEWCSDWYGVDYYTRSPVESPRGPESGTRRVARGGSWRHLVPFSRCAARSALDPAKRFTDFGFRLAA